MIVPKYYQSKVMPSDSNSSPLLIKLSAQSPLWLQNMYVCTWWGLNWQKDSSKSQLFTFYVVLCIKSYWNANFSIKIHFITPWKYAFDVIKMTPHFLLHQLLSRSREVPLGIYFSNYKKFREKFISPTSVVLVWIFVKVCWFYSWW